MKRRVDKLRREKQVLEQKLKLLTEKKEAIGENLFIIIYAFM